MSRDSRKDLPASFSHLFIEQVKKTWITLLLSGVSTLWLAVSSHSQIFHHQGSGELDFGIISWFSQVHFAIAFWGITLSWRLFSGESYGKWGKGLAAKFVLLVVTVVLPAFGLVAASGQIWPATLSNVSGYHSFTLAYAQAASLVALIAFLANALSPGLVSTFVALVYGTCLAITGAMYPDIIMGILAVATLLAGMVIYLRPRFEAGKLKFAQRLSFGFMALFLVIIPVAMCIADSYCNLLLVEKFFLQEMAGCAETLAEKKSLSRKEIQTILTDSLVKAENSTGGDPIFRKARFFNTFFGVTTLLLLGLFMKRFWSLQAGFEEVSDQLAAKTSELEAILRSTREGIIVLRENDSVLFINEPFADLLDIPVQEFSGRAFAEVISTASHVREVKSVKLPETAGEVLPEGNSFSRATIIEWLISPRSPSPEGCEVPKTLVLNCGWVRNLDGKPVAAVGVLHDVSAERRVSEAKTEFVRHVAHEFRTPLTSIHAYTEMLLDGEVKDPPTEKEYLEIVFAETQRLMRMINDLLDIARIESGRRELKIELVSVGEKIRQAAAVLDSQLKKKNMSWEMKIPEPMPSMRADPDLLEQALLNVAGNAVKYTPDGGRITVTVVWDADFTKISVADNGFGISPEHQKKLFGPFFRVSNEETKGIVGTGLGLAAVKSIMEAHHGKVELHSEPGKGSVFTLVFPMRPLVTSSVSE